MKDTKELRSMLSDQLTRLIDGKIDPTKARAIASMSGQVIASKRLELDAAVVGTDYNVKEVDL